MGSCPGLGPLPSAPLRDSLWFSKVFFPRLAEPWCHRLSTWPGSEVLLGGKFCGTGDP